MRARHIILILIIPVAEVEDRGGGGGGVRSWGVASRIADGWGVYD